ncbi:MAG: hypothetical protein HP490_08660 [Nitrospira sp.]|nr:hypothetical protein [Nitrospira sp.]
MSAELEDESPKETITTFVQEAHEWLQQIHVALDELQQGPPPDRHVTLAHTIKSGIINMGGTAATIGLREIEQASCSALPFAEAVENPNGTISTNDFVGLCKQLGHMYSALTRATDVARVAKAVSGHAEGLPVTLSSGELLTILHRFREQQVQLGNYPRNLLETIITQVEGVKKDGSERCNITTLKEFLARWSDGEDVFLESVQKQIPSVTAEINRLKSGAGRDRQPSEQMHTIVEQVAQLWSAAQQVNAAQMMTFCMGLHSFLTLVMQGRVVVAVDKYAAVESRLIENVQALQNWVEAGRMERSAISGILPA